ncbi:hypothetical protein K456DRAFT_256615 [Colletotrichum gloeosporioides 23]|nr:hypothetical protein K456DRAFT_256615 [Colletotrichum gloeosporioides 23]
MFARAAMPAMDAPIGPRSRRPLNPVLLLASRWRTSCSAHPIGHLQPLGDTHMCHQAIPSAPVVTTERDTQHINCFIYDSLNEGSVSRRRVVAHDGGSNRHHRTLFTTYRLGNEGQASHRHVSICFVRDQPPGAQSRAGRGHVWRHHEKLRG